MRPYRLTRTPLILQRARLDNLTLLPASFLPYKEQYQQIANSLSPNGVLIILPETGKTSRKTLERVATHLKAVGYPVTTISADQFAEKR